MINSSLSVVADSFEKSLLKFAAKEKTPKRTILKKIDKARVELERLVADQKKIKKEFDSVKVKYDNINSLVSSKRKEILRMQNASQKMDMADASDAIFHDGDDVSYIIDGKEYYVDLKDGDVSLVPWREHKRSQKPEELVEEKQSSDVEYCGDFEMTDAVDMDQAMLDDLYLKMTEEKKASCNDLIKKWAQEDPMKWWDNLGKDKKISEFNSPEIEFRRSERAKDNDWEELISQIEMNDPTLDDEVDIDKYDLSTSSKLSDTDPYHEDANIYTDKYTDVFDENASTESDYDPESDVKFQKEKVLESKKEPWSEEYDYDKDPYFHPELMDDLNK